MENLDNSNNNPEKSNNQESFNYREIIESLKDLLKEANLNEAVNSFNNVKLERIKSDEKKELETIKSQDTTNSLNTKLWTRKFIKEFCVLSIILIAICYLSYNEYLDKNSTGTLIGSIIGYSIGNFNSPNRNH